MSTTTITFKHKVNGVLTNVTSVVLSDAAAVYGVKRTDTDAVVVAAATALVNQATGIYSYSFTDPAPGLTYNYWLKWVYGGVTNYQERNQSASAIEAEESYLSVSDADTLAATLLSSELAAYNAANSGDKAKALLMATSDLDSAMRWQGRKYDLITPQTLEFPRIPHGDMPPGYPIVSMGGYVVWDWDYATNEAVVPLNVKLAVLYQANSILKGDRNERLDTRHDGVSAHSADGLSEAYSGRLNLLCRRAHALVAKYELSTGEML